MALSSAEKDGGIIVKVIVAKQRTARRKQMKALSRLEPQSVINQRTTKAGTFLYFKSSAHLAFSKFKETRFEVVAAAHLASRYSTEAHTKVRAGIVPPRPFI